jgi:hypothetical protein
MRVIYILLAVSIMLGGACLLRRSSAPYNSRQLAGSLFAMTVLLVMSFMLARGN